jgi:hypothetical protein
MAMKTWIGAEHHETDNADNGNENEQQGARGRAGSTRRLPIAVIGWIEIPQRSTAAVSRCALDFGFSPLDDRCDFLVSVFNLPLRKSCSDCRLWALFKDPHTFLVEGIQRQVLLAL